MCQGFSHFSGVLHNFVMAKLATSSILRVEVFDKRSEDMDTTYLSKKAMTSWEFPGFCIISYRSN